MKFEPKKIPFQKALLQILFSVLFVSGTATVGLIYFQYARSQRINDKKYNIVALMQSSREKDVLKTIYLAELLGLSVDRPTNLYRFNTKEAKHKLLGSGLIKEVVIKKISPGTIYLDYTPRQPVAFLIDYTNTMVDMDGVPMPLKPFFTPKILPEIYLGLSESQELQWGIPITGREKELAFALLKFLTLHPSFADSRISRIDVSKAFASSYGQREIIIIFEDFIESSMSTCTKTLRLVADQYEKQLQNYALLRAYMLKEQIVKPTVIDMRIPYVAFY
jgi:hypothetical protein